MSFDPKAADYRPASEPSRLLQAGVTCWREAVASRARLLVDGAAYFGALRAALLNARRRVFIIGWDIDSRVKLAEHSDGVDDGLPLTLGPFLEALVARRPQLNIRIQLWDYALLYAAGREPLPLLTLGWKTPPQIHFCLDDLLPVGACHHQKLVVIDDAVAFCGGIDLSGRRWDTPDHSPSNPARVDPKGETYPPVHDLQMMVDGEVAGALADLARARWLDGTGATVPPVAADWTVWPDSLEADLGGISAGVARTMPEHDGAPGVHEIERLYHAAIAAAQHTIYIENQYLTSDPMAEALANRLASNQRLQVVIVLPGVHESWIESGTMEEGRNRVLQRLRECVAADRVRVFFPTVTEAGTSAPVLVHAKAMIVDDAVLHVGSANLNHRSMGFDTECDLTLEASSDDHRQTILRLRNGLVGEHLGVSADAVADAIAMTGSLIAAIESLSQAQTGRRLVKVPSTPPSGSLFSAALASVADPGAPDPAGQAADSLLAVYPAPSGSKRLVALGGIAILVLVSALIWQLAKGWTLIDPGALEAMLSAVANHPATIVGVIGLYVLAGLVFFPITVLIAMTGAVIGGLPAAGYALAGSLASGSAGFVLGRLLGRVPAVRGWMDSFLGTRFQRVRNALEKKGVLAVTLIRLVPAAPFTAVNLAAGTTPVRYGDFLWGTAFGMAPGILLTTLLGDTLRQAITDRSAESVIWVVGAVLLWATGVLAVQRLANRLRSAENQHSEENSRKTPDHQPLKEFVSRQSGKSGN